MTNTSDSSATPRLRFPEFCNASPWQRRKLSELLCEQKLRNRDLKYGPTDVLSVSGEFGCVNQIELLGRSYAGASVKEYHVVETGDIVYTKSPLKKNPFGIIKENKGPPGIVSTLYAVYRATELGHPSFLDHYFSRDYHLNSYLQPIVRKGAKNDMKVNNFAVLSGDIFAPSLPEQTKIAEFLTSLDDVIAAEARKVAALKAHKQGLVQQLFPREGETVPQLRFPEFRDAEKWQTARLGAIADILKGKGVAKSDVTPDGMRPCIRYGELYTLYGEVIDDVKSRTDASASGLFLSRSNDVLIPASGETKIDIATAACVLRDGVALGSDLNVIRTSHHGVFLSYLMRSTKREDIARVAQGDTVVHLYPSQLREIIIPLPDAHEQEKIAHCLVSLDATIAAQAAKVEALKAQKRPLIQQLFPPPDAA